MIASRRSRFRNVHPLGEGSALIESQAMATIRGSVRELMDLFKSSRSYRLVAAIVTALTLVPLAIGLIEGFRVGGSVIGYVIWILVSVGFSAPCSASSCGQSP
jgi:hypothetical protein